MPTYLDGDRVLGNTYIIRHNPPQSRSSSISPCVLPVKQVWASKMQVPAKEVGKQVQAESVELSGPVIDDCGSPSLKPTLLAPRQHISSAVSISMAPELTSLLDKENFHQKNIHSNAAGSKKGYDGTPSMPAHAAHMDIGADDSASLALLHYCSMLDTTSMVRNILHALAIQHFIPRLCSFPN